MLAVRQELRNHPQKVVGLGDPGLQGFVDLVCHLAMQDQVLRPDLVPDLEAVEVLLPAVVADAHQGLLFELELLLLLGVHAFNNIS